MPYLMKPLPELSYKNHAETYQTLLLWTQIIGKIKLDKLPWINHSWHVTLHVTPRGLTTQTLRCGDQYFQIDFDFINHQLEITTDSGEVEIIELKDGLSVADFYTAVKSTLEELGINVKIYTTPNELEDPVPFDKDHPHKSYHKEEVERFHKALLFTQDVFTEFRAHFKGKVSPVHFFWGAADLAVTRFSGREAPKHPGGVPNLPDEVAQEAYSHEVSSAGFWPGDESLPEAAFYSYIYPEPEGCKTAKVKPSEAYYHHDLGEFVLPYEAVRKADHPRKALLDFLQSTYEKVSQLADWDKENLEGKSF